MLSIGINTAPLLAPRTGVGRYIAGLLSGLASLAEEPGNEPFEVRALGQGAAGGSVGFGLWASGFGRSGEVRRAALGAVRSVAKALPGGYQAAQMARSLAIWRADRERPLSLFHETNHAAPDTRLPLVITVHDLCTLLFPETQEPARARHFAHALRTRTLLASQVIAPSEAIATQLVSLLGLERARVHAIPHGTEPGLFERASNAQRAPALAQRGVDGDYLLFVGALEPRKGLPTLLDAYDALPDRIARELPLVLAGPPERVDLSLAARLARPRAGRIIELGYTSPDELPGLYRHATALALPSIYEGFGLPLLEALACGLPCAITDDPALVEVAGEAALVTPRGDAQALAGSLERLAESERLRASLSARGRMRAQSFSWEKSARAHLEVYRAAVRDR